MGIKDVQIRNGEKLPIKPFKLEYMNSEPNKMPSILMIAKRNSGKSWIVRAIMYHFKDIPVGLVISQSDDVNPFYYNFFPDSFIYYKYRTDIIEKLMMRQGEIITKAKHKVLEGKKIDTRAFIVMDDCLSSKGSWVRDEPILKLLFEGRHYHIMYILTLQTPLGITPELRSNFDYVFLLAEDFVSNQKKLYEHYAGMFPDLNSFRQIFAQLTEDFGSMVIANKGARRNFLDKIFWYRAPNLSNEKIQIGCKQFNEYHDRNYNKDWRDIHEKKKISIDEYVKAKKKEKETLVVNKINTERGDSDSSKRKR